MSKIFHTFSRSWRWCSNSVKMEDLKQLLLMVSRLLDQNLRRTRIRRFLGEIQADLCRFVTGKRVCTPMVTIYIYSILKKIVQIQWIMYIYIYCYFVLSKYQGIVRNMRKNVNPRFCLPWFDQRFFHVPLRPIPLVQKKLGGNPNVF